MSGISDSSFAESKPDIKLLTLSLVLNFFFYFFFLVSQTPRDVEKTDIFGCTWLTKLGAISSFLVGEQSGSSRAVIYLTDSSAQCVPPLLTRHSVKAMQFMRGEHTQVER